MMKHLKLDGQMMMSSSSQKSITEIRNKSFSPLSLYIICLRSTWSVPLRGSHSLPSENTHTNTPTDPFTTMELQNTSFDAHELNTFRRSLGLEALKLWKGQPGLFLLLLDCYSPICSRKTSKREKLREENRNEFGGIKTQDELIIPKLFLGQASLKVAARLLQTFMQGRRGLSLFFPSSPPPFFCCS